MTQKPEDSSKTRIDKFIERILLPDVKVTELPKQESEVLAELTTLRNDLQRLLTEADTLEEKLSQILLEGKHRGLMELLTRLRVSIGASSLNSETLPGLKEKRLELSEKIQKTRFYYEKHLAPYLNDSNSKEHSGSFCHKISKEELNKIVPLEVDEDLFRHFVTFRGGQDFQAQEKYKKEDIWKQVVWVRLDRHLFAVNVGVKSDIGVIMLRAIELPLQPKDYLDFMARMKGEPHKRRWYWPFGRS